MSNLTKLMILGAAAIGLSACASTDITQEQDQEQEQKQEQEQEQEQEQAPPPDAVPVSPVVRVNQATYGDCIDVAVQINTQAGKRPGNINYFPMRIVLPQSATNHERVVERLNVYVNNAGKIITANCG